MTIRIVEIIILLPISAVSLLIVAGLALAVWDQWREEWG